MQTLTTLPFLPVSTLLQLPCVNVYYHPFAAALEVSWRLTPSSEQLRQVLQVGLRLADQLQTMSWIGDVREFSALLPDDYQWLKQVWLPQLAATTVCSMAVVLPSEDPLAAAVAEAVTTQLLGDHLPLYTQYFDSPVAARQWVCELP